jgi:hypothetical protein
VEPSNIQLGDPYVTNEGVTNQSVASLVEQAVANGEEERVSNGVLVVRTGHPTCRYHNPRTPGRNLIPMMLRPMSLRLNSLTTSRGSKSMKTSSQLVRRLHPK